MPKLYIMQGISGSGKTTWVRNHMNKNTDRHISRDEIRFSILKEDDEYFSKENQVYREFIRQIDENLAQGFNVFADATHLNEMSRNKLLCCISEIPSSIECIWIKTSIEDCLEQNELRKNIPRKYVPRGTIRRMMNQLTPPALEEGFDKIYIIEKNKPIQILEKGDI